MPVGFKDSVAARDYDRARRRHRRAVEQELKAVSDMDSLVAAIDDAERPREVCDSKPGAIQLVTATGVETPKERVVPRRRKSAAINAAISLFRQEDD